MKLRMCGLLNAGAAFAALTLSSAAHADIVISSAATSNVSCASGVCTPTSSTAVLNVGDLETLLASGNVKLAAAAEPVDVDIGASLSWVSTNALTLDSYHSINVEQPVAITGGGGLALITNHGGTGGVFDFASDANVAIWSLSSSLMINSHAYTLVGNIAALASDIAANPSGYYALANAYDASNDGTYGHSPIMTTFEGTFTGLGNSISNFSIYSTGGAGCGLFLESGGTVENLNLSKTSVVEKTGGPIYVGGLIGSNFGLLFNDRVSGSVRLTAEYGAAGGAVGYNYGAGTITATVVAGEVDVTSHSNRPGDQSAGGLAGLNEAPIEDSAANVIVYGKGPWALGGLAGINGGDIAASLATGDCSGSCGGLVGVNYGNIANSYATGKVRGDGGGFVGFAQGYASEIINSYSTGEVPAGQRNAGGFMGSNLNGTVSTDYWDTKTSKTKDGVGGGNIPGVTGMTTAKFRAGLPSGFDPTIWAESPSINKGFPYLIANPPQ